MKERNQREEDTGPFRLAFLQTAAEASAALTLAATDAAFDEAVDGTLQRLGELFALDRAYLFLFSENMERMTNTHEWCAAGVEPQMHRTQDLPTNTLPWWKERILECRPVHLPDVEGLPPGAEAEKREFRAQGIRSLLCLPTRSQSGRAAGFLGFDAVRRALAWSEDQIVMLQLVADTIGTTLTRRRAEAALRESEERYRLLADNSVDMISRHAADGTVWYVSPSCESLTGYTRAELLGQAASFLAFPEDMEHVWDVIRRAQEAGDHYRLEHRLRRRDGVVIWVETLGRFVRDEAGRVTEIQCNVRDVTQRKRAEEALRENEERLRFISDHVPGWLVYQIDSGVDGAQRRLTYISAGVEPLHEITPVDAMEDMSRIYQQVCEEDRARVAEQEAAALETLAPLRVEVRVTLPSGRTGWRLFTSAPRRLPDSHIVWDGIEIDITQQKQEEELQRRIRTLEGLATVAGGIAHDFNNLLTGVFSNVQLAQLDLAPDHPARDSLETALQALDACRQITTRLLTFAKGGQPVLEGVDLRQRVRDTVRFHLAGSRVAARFDMPPDLWPARADRGQIAEVVSNLTLNAREAMPAGGTFHVQARNVPGIRDAAAPELRGDCVELNFRDDGVGIPASVIDRVFDPYFSTKQAGSGLGLAIVHGIVRRHGGHIGVESVPDGGTTFTVCLPADSTGLAGRVLGPAAASEAPSRRSGHVLIMDDEEVVRNTAARSLRRLGYSVETVVNGREAIQAYAAGMRRGRPFDLTIMDLTIPGGLGGKEAIRDLLALDPSARVILSSGYSSDPVFADFAVHGFCGCLVKPFNVQELDEAVSRALEGR